jgi:hypothetical protein
MSLVEVGGADVATRYKYQSRMTCNTTESRTTNPHSYLHINYKGKKSPRSSLTCSKPSNPILCNSLACSPGLAAQVPTQVAILAARGAMSRLPASKAHLPFGPSVCHWHEVDHVSFCVCTRREDFNQAKRRLPQFCVKCGTKARGMCSSAGYSFQLSGYQKETPRLNMCISQVPIIFYILHRLRIYCQRGSIASRPCISDAHPPRQAFSLRLRHLKPAVYLSPASRRP